MSHIADKLHNAMNQDVAKLVGQISEGKPIYLTLNLLYLVMHHTRNLRITLLESGIHTLSVEFHRFHGATIRL